MIPEEKRAAVAQGLDEAFGTRSIEEIRQITRGLSTDLVYRIVVHGSPYLLRIQTQIDERNDPVRIFTCMKAAARAGLAPDIRYANEADGIAIIDWIETAPFSEAQAFVHLPVTLRKLHRLPAFPKAFNFVTAHKFFIWRLRTAGLLPEPEIEEVFQGYARICDVYPRFDADLVSSHMDLKPENILFDGHRVWLIDWMAAFLNDRYFDLGIVANFVVRSDADAPTYLGHYFGRGPDDYEMARFLLMRQVLHVFSAAVFLLLGAAGNPTLHEEGPPSFDDFHKRIWAGEIDLKDNRMKVVYGRVHWEQLLRNLRRADFEQALRIVKDRNGRSGVTPLLLPSSP